MCVGLFFPFKVQPCLIDHSSAMESQDPYMTCYPTLMHVPQVSVSCLYSSELLGPGPTLGVPHYSSTFARTGEAGRTYLRLPEINVHIKCENSYVNCQHG